VGHGIAGKESAGRRLGEDVTNSGNCDEANRAPRTILLVEDDAFVRQATCNILEHAGFEVLTAQDATEAMKVYGEHAFEIDLVMTDMVLPGASGQQLSQSLRRRSPAVAVLITSGYSNAEFDMEEPKTLTFFLAKPYSRQTLLDKIKKILTPIALARPA
jgi:DNA-binding NtrC family response regulator